MPGNKKIKFKLLLFLLILSNLVVGQGRKMRLYPLSGRKLSLERDSLKICASDFDGRFTLGTEDGEALLFGFPADGANSLAKFNIDGNIWSTNGLSSATHPMPTLVSGPFIGDSSVVCKWEKDGLSIEQEISINTIRGKPATKIHYRVANRDTIAHLFGLLLFLDTKINENDCAPIATQYDYSSLQREFIAPDIPSYWLAFERGPFQPSEYLVGRGSLMGFEATQPDRLVCGNYWDFRDVGWEYTVESSDYEDSCILLRWNKQEISPGETLEFTTYYGVGMMETLEEDLSLSLISPSELRFIGCSEIVPNPFSVNLLVRNSSGVPASSLKAKLELPSPFATDSLIEEVTPVSLRPGSLGTANWEVTADPALFSDSLYSITGKVIGERDTVSVSREIRVSRPSEDNPDLREISPTPGTVTSCSLFNFGFKVYDSNRVDLGGIEISINDSLVPAERLDSVFYSYPNFRASIDISDIDSLSLVIIASDRHGCTTTSDRLLYRIDSSPPEVINFYPPSGEFAIGESIPESLFVRFHDTNSVLAESLRLMFPDDSFQLSHPDVYFDDGSVVLTNFAEKLIDWEVSSVEVCVGNIMDTVVRCGPNRTDSNYCWNFTFHIPYPSAEIISPLPEKTVSCSLYHLRVRLKDTLYGIDDSSISLTMNDRLYSLSSEELDFEDELLIFEVPIERDIMDTLEFSLEVENSAGVSLETPLNWKSFVDNKPPSIEPIYPSHEDIIITPNPRISVEVNDRLSSIDLSSLQLLITTSSWRDSFVLSDEEVDFEDSILTIPLSRSEANFNGCDTAEFKLQVSDSPDVDRVENIKREIWQTPTDCTHPRAVAMDDTAQYFVSCDTITYSWIIEGDDSVNYSSLNLKIDDFLNFSLASPFVNHSSDTLIISLPNTYLSSADTHKISVDSLTDNMGNSLVGSSYVNFSIDNEAPVFVSSTPGHETVCSTSHPTIRAKFRDDISGVDLPSSFVVINGDTFTTDDYLNYEDGEFSLNTSEIPFLLDREDTINVLWVIYDNGEVCEPNIMLHSYRFFIESSEPTFYLEDPAPLSIISCDSLDVKFLLEHPAEIMPASIKLSVGDSIFNYRSDQMRYRGDTLFYRLLPYQMDKTDTLVFNLVSVTDSFGSPLSTDFPNFALFVDRKAPEITRIYPHSGEELSQRISPLKIGIDDAYSIDLDSSLISIEDTIFTFGEAASSDSLVVLRPEENNFRWADTNYICVRLRDKTDRCAPNVKDSCWRLFYDNSPPNASLLSPITDSSYISCNNFMVRILLSDEDRIVSDSLQLFVNGERWERGLYSFNEGTLEAFVSVGRNTADSLTVRLNNLMDSYGMENKEDLSWVFNIDRKPPASKLLYMDFGDTLLGAGLNFVIADSISGVEWDSTQLFIEGIPITEGSFTRLVGDTFKIKMQEIVSTYDFSNEIQLSLYLMDQAELCGKNDTTIKGNFFLNNEAPNLSYLKPLDGTITHNKRQNVLLKCWDNQSHIDSVYFEVDGSELSLASEELDYDSSDSILSFIPRTSYPNFEKLEITAQVFDDRGHSSRVKECEFYTDFSPPDMFGVNPQSGSRIDDSVEFIDFQVADSISGVDDESMVLEFRDEKYTIYSPKLTFEDNTFRFNISDFDLVRDTVWVLIDSLSDVSPDYGVSNDIEELPRRYFFLRPDGINCNVHPSPFTPNEDGINDEAKFEVGGADPRNVDITIFTLEGELVKNVDQRNSKGEWVWDGTNNSNFSLHSGIYVYTVAINKEVKCKGTVVIAR